MYFYFKDVHISIYFGHATKFRSLLSRQCGILFNMLSFTCWNPVIRTGIRKVCHDEAVSHWCSKERTSLITLDFDSVILIV